MKQIRGKKFDEENIDMMETGEKSPGGQMDASVVVLYATAMFFGCFGRFSAVFHEC